MNFHYVLSWLYKKKKKVKLKVIRISYFFYHFMEHSNENIKQHTGKKSIKKRNKENHFPKLLFFSGYSLNNGLTDIFAACKKSKYAWASGK